jgi:hypothetical protein
MRQKLSDQEFHALYCPVKNTKSALFLVAFFSVTAFVNWKGLHKAPEHPDLIELLFVIIVVVMLAKWLVNFTCFRERLVFGLIIVSMVTGEVEGFVPSVFSQHVEMVRSGHLALSLLGLLVSLSMLVHSARSPNAEPNEPQTSTVGQPKRKFFIFAVITLTILALGTLLYFLPLR